MSIRKIFNPKLKITRCLKHSLLILDLPYTPVYTKSEIKPSNSSSSSGCCYFCSGSIWGSSLSTQTTRYRWGWSSIFLCDQKRRQSYSISSGPGQYFLASPKVGPSNWWKCSKILVILQWRKRWLTDSASSPHRKHLGLSWIPLFMRFS